jgi:peptidoglycan/xylan/chitin deacetylase (PgdA/CDA1 family)
MTAGRRWATLLLLSLLGSGSIAVRSRSAPPAATGRAVALTFDDLPATRAADLADARDVTARLLAHLRGHRIPSIGFVNEAKLDVPGEEGARRALLEAWLDAGHDLGNHTYSHVRLYDTPLAAYQADVLRGERVTRALMAGRGRRPRYFRHPTLNTGPDLPTKRAFERFLADHGYAVGRGYRFIVARRRPRRFRVPASRQLRRAARAVLDPPMGGDAGPGPPGAAWRSRLGRAFGAPAITSRTASPTSLRQQLSLLARMW